MKLNFEAYKDKVYACWIGKNIGGTMGLPYEGSREFLDIKGFTTEKNVALPNDDLDLQLVWLRAMEVCGAKGLTKQALGEFWLSFITPHWNEYGTAKNNMSNGFYPPLCGDAFNVWKHSNGAWIRTEIWACLAPGFPELACKYAYDDGCIDHGSLGEGTIAAVFVAALESAAFVETDIRKLIELGLSYIPEDSRVAMSVRSVVECYDKGLDYKAARDLMLEQNADIGDGWFQAPSNVAYVVIGLLWGEGDFKKSMIYALNCGDDTDCTGGTLGSIFGIINGTNGIPCDWREHIGDSIVTMSISLGVLQYVPKSCAELTERVVRLAPKVLLENDIDIVFTDEADEIEEDFIKNICNDKKALQLFKLPSYSYIVDLWHTKATVILNEDPKIAPLQKKKIKIEFEQDVKKNGWAASNCTLKFRWWLPEGFEVKGDKTLYIWHNTSLTQARSEVEFEICAPESVEAINRLVLEVEVTDKMSFGYIPITFLG